MFNKIEITIHTSSVVTGSSFLYRFPNHPRDSDQFLADIKISIEIMSVKLKKTGITSEYFFNQKVLS